MHAPERSLERRLQAARPGAAYGSMRGSLSRIVSPDRPARFRVDRVEILEEGLLDHGIGLIELASAAWPAR